VKVLEQRLPLHDVAPFQRIVRIVVRVPVLVGCPEVLGFRNSIFLHATVVFAVVVVGLVVVVVVVVMMVKATRQRSVLHQRHAAVLIFFGRGVLDGEHCLWVIPGLFLGAGRAVELIVPFRGRR